MPMSNPLAALVAARALTGHNRPARSLVDCEPYAAEPEPYEQPVRVRELRGLAWLRLRRQTRPDSV
jgi:hypothetical protein